MRTNDHMQTPACGEAKSCNIYTHTNILTDTTALRCGGDKIIQKNIFHAITHASHTAMQAQQENFMDTHKKAYQTSAKAVQRMEQQKNMQHGMGHPCWRSEGCPLTQAATRMRSRHSWQLQTKQTGVEHDNSAVYITSHEQDNTATHTAGDMARAAATAEP